MVVDRCLGRHLTGAAVRCQIDDFQLRVERVVGLHLGKQSVRDACEGEEDFADVLREQGRTERRDRQHLQAMHDRRSVAVVAGVLNVVVDRMVVGGDCLERYGRPSWRSTR